MLTPANLKELQQVRGMVNYIWMYIPNLAMMMKPMNDLLKKEAQWSWGPVQDNAFAKVKQALVDVATLNFTIHLNLSLHRQILLVMELKLSSYKKKTIV